MGPVGSWIYSWEDSGQPCLSALLTFIPIFLNLYAFKIPGVAPGCFAHAGFPPQVLGAGYLLKQVSLAPRVTVSETKYPEQCGTVRLIQGVVHL